MKQCDLHETIGSNAILRFEGIQVLGSYNPQLTLQIPTDQIS